MDDLLQDLEDLLVGMEANAEQYKEKIDKVHPRHKIGAVNLLDYAYLRAHDHSKLQAALYRVGATRLSTTEPCVRARLQAAHNVVSRIMHKDIKYEFSYLSDKMAEADDLLEEHSELLLGTSPNDSPALIMVTLPAEAADDYEMVLDFAKSGMDLARINCAHDGPEVWKKMIANVRRAEEEIGHRLEVSMDLAGPKIRTAGIADGPAVGRARVTRDEAGVVLTRSKLWITRKPYTTDNVQPPAPAGLPGRPALPVQVDAAWFDRLTVGAQIMVHDTRGSRRYFTVTDATPDGVLAQGERNAYIADGTLLECDYERTRVTGIPTTTRKLRLEAGDELILTTDQSDADLEAPGTPKIGCTLPLAVESIKVGDEVLFDDGAIGAHAVSVDKRGEDTEVTLHIDRTKVGGANLAAYKGINLPDTDLPLPSLTEEDEENLKFIGEYADIAAVSFIRTPEDVAYVLDKMPREDLGLLLKIETIPGFENLPLVILEGLQHERFGVMIARGDLAVELGFARMAEVPQQIQTAAEAAHIPTVMATQILENLAKNGLPSRAEITDAAVALRSECVMLNKGPHITDAIKILDKMAKKLGKSQRKNRIMLRHIHSWDRD